MQQAGGALQPGTSCMVNAVFGSRRNSPDGYDQVTKVAATSVGSEPAYSMLQTCMGWGELRFC